MRRGLKTNLAVRSSTSNYAHNVLKDTLLLQKTICEMKIALPEAEDPSAKLLTPFHYSCPFFKMKIFH